MRCMISTTAGSDVCVSRSAGNYQEGISATVRSIQMASYTARTGDYATISLLLFTLLYCFNKLVHILFMGGGGLLAKINF